MTSLHSVLQQKKIYVVVSNEPTNILKNAICEILSQLLILRYLK